MDAFVRFTQALIREHSTMVLALFAGLFMLAAAAATGVRIDTRLEGMIAAGDPELGRTRAIWHEFSNDETVVAAFELGHPFTAADLRKLRRISDRMAAVDGVEEVADLSNIEDVRGSRGEVDASPLVDFEALGNDVSAIHDRVRDHRLYQDLFVFDDLDLVGTIVIFEPDIRDKERAHGAIGRLREILAEEAPPWRYHLVGMSVLEVEGDALIRGDLARLGPVLFVMIVGLVYLATRRLFALGLLVLLIAWSEIVTLAWFSLSETPLTMITSIVPVILLATTSTYAIYFLGLLQGLLGESKPGVAVIRPIARPVLLSAVSTGIGFLSLRLLPARVIGELGTALSVGIAATLIGTLFLLPAVVERRGLRMSGVPMPWLDRVGLYGVRLADRPLATLVVAGAMTAVAVGGIGSLEFANDPLHYLKPDDPYRQSAEIVREKLSGGWIVNALVETGRPGGALEPTTLAFAQRLVDHSMRHEIVEHSLSFLDYIYLMDEALRPGLEPRTVLPSRELAAQYMLLYEVGGDPGDYRHYINHDRSSLRLVLRLNDSGSQKIVGLRDHIGELAKTAPEGVRASMLGISYLFAKTMATLANRMVWGLATALSLIALTMAIWLRSIRLALVAIIPNALPILICLGAMGWLGYPISVGTSIVGCVALGLAVDDTAHIIGHLTSHGSLRETYAVVGRPVALTSLALGLGFSILAFSEFQSVALMGAATALTLGVAFLFDLLVLPSLLVLAGFKRI